MDARRSDEYLDTIWSVLTTYLADAAKLPTTIRDDGDDYPTGIALNFPQPAGVIDYVNVITNDYGSYDIQSEADPGYDINFEELTLGEVREELMDYIVRLQLWQYPMTVALKKGIIDENDVTLPGAQNSRRLA